MMSYVLIVLQFGDWLTNNKFKLFIKSSYYILNYQSYKT